VFSYLSGTENHINFALASPDVPRFTIVGDPNNTIWVAGLGIAEGGHSPDMMLRGCL
jgi:hypothetical protein